MTVPGRVAVDDQRDAASAEAAVGFAALAAKMDRPIRFQNEDPALDRVLAELLPTVAGCGHLQTPRPVSLVLWERPRVLRCDPCLAAAGGRIVDAAAATTSVCDLCGRTVDPAPVPFAAVGGPLTVYGARCPDCGGPRG